MATDMGMINDFIQKEEEVKEELFSGTKHHCIFEITHPNKHSECYFCKLVQDFKEVLTWQTSIRRSSTQ